MHATPSKHVRLAFDTVARFCLVLTARTRFVLIETNRRSFSGLTSTVGSMISTVFRLRFSQRAMRFSKHQFELIAYRGGAGERPENTISAFRNAVKSNGDVILDLDVQFTADEQVVVIHDETLERTTNGTGKICDHLFEEIQDLDAGYNFSVDGKSFPFRGDSDAKVVGLDDILSSFPAQRMLIDIRRFDHKFVARVVETVRKHNAGNRCVIMSESNRTIRFARALDRSLLFAASAFEVRLIFFGMKLGVSRLLPSKSRYFMIPEEHNSMRILSPRFQKELHRRQKTVFVWTVDDLTEARRLRDLGVDGIFTNFPDRIQQSAD